MVLLVLACSRKERTSLAKADPYTPSSDTAGVKVSCRYMGTEKVGSVKEGSDSLPVMHHSFLFRLSVDNADRLKDQSPEHLDFGMQNDFVFSSSNGELSPVLCQRESRSATGLSYLVVFEVADSIRLPITVGYNDKTFGSGPRYFQFSEFLNIK